VLPICISVSKFSAASRGSPCDSTALLILLCCIRRNKYRIKTFFCNLLFYPPLSFLYIYQSDANILLTMLAYLPQWPMVEWANKHYYNELSNAYRAQRCYVLKAKILASASVSKLWPWPQTFGLGLASVCSRRTSSQEEIDGPICLHFTLPTTGHHTTIEDSYCARENEKLNCVVWIKWYKFAWMLSTNIWYFLFVTLSLTSALASTSRIGLDLGLDLKALASISALGPWPRPRDFGLV